MVFLDFGFLKSSPTFYGRVHFFIVTILFIDSGAFYGHGRFLWPRAKFIKIKVAHFLMITTNFFAITTIFSLSKGGFYDIGGLLSKSW